MIFIRKKSVITYIICVAVFWGLLVPLTAIADSPLGKLRKFWSERYGDIKMPVDDSRYLWRVLAKAKPDECYYGIDDERNRLSFKIIYPGDLGDSDTEYCITFGGKPKVNQAYVWGLTKTGDDLWFGTIANTHCLVLDSFFPPGTFPSHENDSWVCEMSFKDARPPRIFVYNTKGGTLTDKTAAVISSDDTSRLRLLSTIGLRSAGSKDDVVFLGGISQTGVNLFAFNAKTKNFIGSQNYSLYTNIRQWRVINKELYVGVGTAGGGGEILRWVGNADDPFHFETVGEFQGDPAYLTEHKGRIYVSTWGEETGIGGMILYMSPLFGNDRKLTCKDKYGWKDVWRLSDYEVEPAALQGGGALISYGSWLYWGTMHVPGTGLYAYTQYYPDGPIDFSAFLGTYRPIMIFRGRQFDTKQQRVEVLYGSYLLPKYDPDTNDWQLVPNNMGQRPKYGLPGINNFFNNYTWWMEVYHGRLFVGTMDWLYLATEGFTENFGGEIPEMIQGAIQHFEGADLYRFNSLDSPAVPVSLSGVGNYTSYGIRAMVSDDALYLGMANPMNLLTDPSDQIPEGGWELIKLRIEDELGVCRNPPHPPKHSRSLPRLEPSNKKGRAK